MNIEQGRGHRRGKGNGEEEGEHGRGVRGKGGDMDDAYFLSMLEPDDIAAMSREADVVVWTRE